LRSKITQRIFNSEDSQISDTLIVKTGLTGRGVRERLTIIEIDLERLSFMFLSSHHARITTRSRNKLAATSSIDDGLLNVKNPGILLLL
jgi:hypothetical protein